MTEQTTDATDTGTPANTNQQATDTEPDWKAEAEKWKGLARKHEDQWKANASKVDQYDRLVEASKTDQERLEERATTAEGTAKDLSRENLILKVALAKGVPADLIERLKGDTQEDLEKDADFLIEKFGQTTPPAQSTVPDLRAAVGQRQVTGEPNADDWLRRASGRR